MTQSRQKNETARGRGGMVGNGDDVEVVLTGLRRDPPHKSLHCYNAGKTEGFLKFKSLQKSLQVCRVSVAGKIFALKKRNQCECGH